MNLQYYDSREYAEWWYGNNYGSEQSDNDSAYQSRSRRYIFFDINNANFQIAAAPVSISGRVISSLGRGISNARVHSTDQNGTVRTAITNSSGYYRFTEMDSGQTYIFNVSQKRYRFTPRVVSVIESLGKFDFVAEN